MAAKKRRENTFRIEYANVPKKPSSEEVHRFVGETLGLKREEVLRIQYSRNTGIAFVKTPSLELAQKVVEDNDDKHELMVDGKPYKLRMRMEDGAVLVRLFNLSEDVTNEEIEKFLIAYGEILSIQEELSDAKHFFPGLPTGVRIVRMCVQKAIASYVTIDGETTLLSYNGQQQTCRYCGEYIHNGISCVQNKKLLVQKLATNSSSYADVMKNPKPRSPKPTASKLLASKPNLQTPRPVKPTEKPQIEQETTISPTEPCSMGTMPPNVDTGIDNFLKPADVQQNEDSSTTWIKVTRKTSSHTKSDGNETDSSTSSRRSRRPLGKKMRCDDDPQNSKPTY